MDIELKELAFSEAEKVDVWPVSGLLVVYAHTAAEDLVLFSVNRERALQLISDLQARLLDMPG